MSNSNILLLNTNTVLYLIKGDEKVFQLVDNKPVAIYFIIEIELISWKFMTAELKSVIEDFMKDVLYFEYSYRVKEKTISLRQKYNFKLADAFIAATALEYNLTLVSADKVFSKADDLNLINFIPFV